MEKNTGTGGAGEMVLVYSHLPRHPHKDSKARVSILVKNETGEVYGGGLNYTEGSRELNNYTKVGLDGDVKKIVVGEEFCAALTHDGRLMVWQHTRFSKPDNIELRRYKLGERCLSCGDGCTDMYGLAYCDRCGMYQRGREGDNCNSIIIFRKERTLLCLNCSEPHTTETIKIWDQVECKSTNVNVAFCASCKRFLFGYHYSIMNMNYAENNSVRTILRKNDERIKDVAFLWDETCLLTENNNLYCRNPYSNDEYKMKLLTKDNSSPGEMVDVYGGGGWVRQLFVKYEDGSLFKCSDIDLENNTCLLRNVKLPAAIENVSCGFINSAVLLNDGSVWFITPDSNTHRLVHESGLNLFTDIAVIANTDVYLVQAPTGTRVHGSEMKIALSSARVVVEFYEAALNTVLKEMVPPTPRTEDSSNITATTLPIQILPPPTPYMAQLYGKSHLSDMTIKLAVEELPAHSSILFATSSHFQKTFNADNPPPKVLDVSHYNPQAYKYLLQYYYQTQPDDLDAEGFVHLRQLAASYGETSLADAATAEIKSQLCEDNVERIFTLSKRFNFQDLAIECERIMRSSQPFMEKLLETHMKNLATSEDMSGQ